jgi:hypothetical protein
MGLLGRLVSDVASSAGDVLASPARIAILAIVAVFVKLLLKHVRDSQELRTAGLRQSTRQRIIESVAAFLLAVLVIGGAFGALAWIEHKPPPRRQPTIGPVRAP